MKLRSNVTGIQHIGIPSRQLDVTIRFFESLGFEVVHRNTADNQPIAFLQCGSVMMEVYQRDEAKAEAGAIDHIALNVQDMLFPSCCIG